MKKLITILSAVLAVQLVLSGIIFAVQEETGAFHSEQALLGMNKDDFDGISIEQKDKPVLTLKKAGESWLLPTYFNAPVAVEKLNEFSRKLLHLKTGWPVASTEDAADRFQVKNGKFERLIVFQKEGKPVKTLYLGTSPGFKKIHARVEGQKDIQVIEFGAFEASVAPEDWVKQDLAKIDTSQLSQIKAKEFTLIKAGKDWTVEGLQANQSVKDAEVKGFIDKLTGLSYSGIWGIEDKPEYHLKDSALSFMLKKQAEEISYQFGKPDAGDDYVLKLSNQPYYFKVTKAQFDSLKEVNKEKLVLQKPVEDRVKEEKKPVKKE